MSALLKNADLALALPAELVEVVAERAAELVAGRLMAAAPSRTSGCGTW